MEYDDYMRALRCAMEETLRLAKDRGMPALKAKLHPWMTYDHCVDILHQLQEPDIDRDKANRLVGWAQCAIVGAGCASPDAFRDINRRFLTNG